MASRQHGIGGSDIGSLLSNQIPVEYGCERRLWLRLSGYPTDGPDHSTEPMILGQILEKYIVRAYQDRTGNTVKQFGLKKHPTVDCLQYHDDGEIFPHADHPRKTNGVLECKGIGREMMAKVHEFGIIPDYILQAQSGMAAFKLDWAAFAVGMREDLMPLVVIEMAAIIAGEPIPTLPRQPKIVTFEVERDDAICNAIESYAPKFWGTLKDESKIPPREEPESPKCQRCPYAKQCQGAAVMEGIQTEHGVPERRDLDLLIQEYRDRSALLEEATDLVNETQRKFKNALDKTTAVKVNIEGKWKNIIYRIRKGAERVDGKRMAAQYDALRRAAIEAGVAGAELVPPSGQFINVGMPSRPLLLSSVLPKKEKKPGEVPETDEESYEDL